jgi:hypothetical protein
MRALYSIIIITPLQSDRGCAAEAFFWGGGGGVWAKKVVTLSPLLRSTAGNIFSMYLANIFFGEFRAGNLNAKFNINSYIRNKEGWLK